MLKLPMPLDSSPWEGMCNGQHPSQPHCWADMTCNCLHTKGRVFKQNMPPFLLLLFDTNLLANHFFHIFFYISGSISLSFCSSCILKLTFVSKGPRTSGLWELVGQHGASSGCHDKLMHRYFKGHRVQDLINPSFRPIILHTIKAQEKLSLCKENFLDIITVICDHPPPPPRLHRKTRYKHVNDL